MTGSLPLRPQRPQTRRRWIRYIQLTLLQLEVANYYALQIRRRRLEKLSGTSAPKITQQKQEPAETSSSFTTPVASENTGPAPKTTIHVSKAPTLAIATSSTIGSSNGPDNSTVRDTSADGQLKRLRAKSDGQTTPRPNPPKRQAPASVDESLEAYENKTLGTIFRITLDPNQTFDSSHHKLTYLPNLRQELEDDQAPIMLTKERLDSAILEAASAVPHSKGVLDYLIPCWKRVMKASKALRGNASAKDAILKEAKRLCMSNCVFAVEMPDLFGSVSIIIQNTWLILEDVNPIQQ